MGSWDTELSMAEAHPLAELEATIARGLRTFYDVGQALTVLRDERLYRAGYTTFERYCQARWSMVRQRAYQLMDAAAIMSNVYSSRQGVCPHVTAGYLEWDAVQTRR